ncbi:hypothetical protein E1301_Tti019102 [Triplophysa tibetana]|uniref:Immunoglobulin domain-containing protein n=1 Tax=Triplophysa tibetana TaxID=1572043 RepID=A0A5A9NU40_9TELE|nr:hypothetical protein E1301_Tti019102 [Triplophysa tibetana]
MEESGLAFKPVSEKSKPYISNIKYLGTVINNSKHLVYNCYNGVFGDEVKSVMEGDSVTLNTDVIKQRDDLIVWCYGPDDAVVAIINGKVGSTKLSDDERYKDRLELNDQTGSLTINNLTTNHSGVYKLKISSNKTVSYKRFNVTVSESIMKTPHANEPLMEEGNI